MFTGQGASIARRRLLRFWSMTLSAVLAITLLQVAPPANAAPDVPIPTIDLVARYKYEIGDTSPRISLEESQIVDGISSTSYRLDLQATCGKFGFADPSGTGSNDSQSNDWDLQPSHAQFFGAPSYLDSVLSNLILIRPEVPFIEGGTIPEDCPTSIIKAWVQESSASWDSNSAPSDKATYAISTSSPVPELSKPTLTRYNNGFSLAWPEYTGAVGFTPTGFTLKYRETATQQNGDVNGPWQYVNVGDNYTSAVVEVPVDPDTQEADAGISYEAFVAPNVRDCDGGSLFGEFEPIDQVSYFGIDPDPAAGLVGSAISTGDPVVSQCFAACTPVESVAFDGENLATILKFTNTEPCTWTVPSNYTSNTVDAYVVGGGGGGGAAGGGGGGGGGFETPIGLPIALDDTWTVRVGTGGAGSDLASPRGGSGTSSSVTYPGSNGVETITAVGGGGGGTKDNSGENSGGDGIYTETPLRLTFGGYGSGSAGAEGLRGALVSSQAYGDGGEGGDGSTLGTSFIEEIFASGGGGGAKCLPNDNEFYLNYSGGISGNSGYGGSCELPDGSSALANTGGGGGGGASNADVVDGAGGDGGSGVVYIVHTETPLARYNPSGCFAPNGIICEIWYDTTGNQYLTATVFGAPAITSTSDHESFGSISLEPFPVVKGTPSDSIVFPASITPSSGYTLFTVARYNEIVGGQYRRIFDSAVTPDVDNDEIPEGVNWLSGFWGGKSGIAYHGDSPTSSYQDRNWLTPDETSIHNANWVLSTDQKNLYRSNGTKRSVDNYAGGVGPEQIVVNQVNRTESSDFQIADIITFSRELNADEYQAVEAYLSGEYGICLGTCSPPVFETDSLLPNGDFRIEYSQTITATGPIGSSITYLVSAGELPTELRLDPTSGELSGTPETSGTFTFTVEAKDTMSNETASKDFTITINEEIPPPPSDPPVFETGSALLDGEVGLPYFQPVIAISADRNSVSYAVVAGELPAGLALDTATGEISGTPNVSGPFTFTIEATDTVNLETASQEFTIFVIPLPDGPATTLRDGYTGIYYQVKTIGSGVYSINNDFSVISGDLPDGLGLSRRSGKISGTPIETGEFTFTIRLENNTTEEIESQAFTISISSDPQITPVGCEDYSESSFVPDNFWLDDNGYPIGCDMDGQESVTPVIADNEATEEVVESWSQRFDNRVNLDYFNLRNGWKCDDCSIGLQGEVSDEGPPGSGSSTSSTGLPLGFSFNYYGKTYNSVFVNSNGSLTFGAPSTCYDQTLTQIMRCGGTSGTSAIVAYGVDLDNSDLNPDVWGNPQVRHADFFYWGKTFTEDGKQAFVATWINSPGYCDGDETTEYSEFGYRYDTCDYEDFNEDPTGISYEETLSTFQIVIIDQSSAIGGVEGDADVIINYGSMQDSQNGYDSCDISRGDSSSYDEDCDPTSERYLAVGLGSTQVNAVDSELWDSSVTSLQALDGSGPGTILYNGIDASQVGDTGDYPLSSARQFEGSVPGRFEYVFRANSSPDVATIPSAPTASLGSATENSIEVTIEPPTNNGGTPVLVYSIEYRIAGETSWTTDPTNAQYTEPSATYVLTNLTPSTSYEIRVFANNGIGNSEPTETISLSTSAALGAPETPSFSSPEPFVVQSNGQIDYSIELLSPLPDSILVRYRPTVQGTSATLPWVTETLASNAIGGSTGTLNPDTQYEFQVSARNSFGSSAWSESALVTSSPVDDRSLDAGGVRWMGYGSQISAALEGYGGDGLVYDGALKVFVGTGSRSTAIQIECDQSSISYPGFDVGVEGKQGHYEWETAETRVQGGYTVTCPPVPVTLSGQEVLVSLSRFFFTDSPWTRVMIDVTNLDQSEVSVGVWLESELQPEINAGDTSYEASSSSNNPASPATGDRWVVTGDSKQSGMVVAHVFGQLLDDPNISDGVNQDGSDLMLSEFWMSVPGTSSNKQNSSRLAWFDGIVQYDVASDPNELNENYAGAVATAKTAAENFTKVKSQLTDTYPRFVPPTLTNFRMPDQIRVSPGIFHELKAARISGLAPNLDLGLNFNAGYIGGEIPVTFKVSNAAKQCIDNSLNGNLFANDGNIEVDNVGLTIEGSQAELNCFIDGLSFSIPNSPDGASGTYGYLFTDLTDLTDLSSPRGLSELGTKLIFDGASDDQTLIDVEAGNATWRGVGTGINDVETRSNRNAYDEGSLKVYWIPNVNADPLTEGIEIVCPQDVEGTSLLDNSQVKVLTCAADEVVTTGGPLSISITRNFATSDPWQQLELDVTNNGEEDIRGALAYRLELGSDENTEIEMTSDGDLNLESIDSWFITSDDGQRTDPVLLHYVGYEAGQKITRGTDANIDKIWVKTPLVVAGGYTASKRYLEGVIDTPRGQIAESVVVAMRAADDVANNTYRVPGGMEGLQDSNILDIPLSAAVTLDRDLPPLRIIYECRDYGHNALGPITLQRDGKVIGCDAFGENEEEGSYGPGGPGGNFSDEPIDASINAGLFPGDQSLDENERRDAWARTFSSVFPNAQPRLGWACDGCIVTREGVVSNSDYEVGTPSGLPLGFSMNLGQTESDPTLSPTSSSTPSPTPSPTQSDVNYDSIRITPHGVVQVHDSRNPDDNSGHAISAFGNLAMSNGALQGNWEELPEFDFFYWGRTVYQGRLAFVVTWVKIPTVEFQSSNGLNHGVPKPGLEPTSVQLMLVSDSYPGQLGEYLDSDPEDRPLSNVDLIWNFFEIQSEDAVALHGDVDSSDNPLQVFSGTWQFMSGYTPLFSDEMTEANFGGETGLGVESNDCPTTCVVDGLLSNKLQSPIDGRYVIGYRDYFKNQEFFEGAPKGFLAPAAPRSVEVSRNDATVASLSWKAPVPWVISIYSGNDGPLAGAEPIYGYRIEYAENGRGEEYSGDVFPPLNQEPLSISDLSISGDEMDPRFTYEIDDLQEGEQYTFRVYAVYAGLDLPDPATDLMFDSEIRGVPSLADERHDSALEISPVGLQENPMASYAEAIAAQIAGGLEISNATINGSTYADGVTANSVATFTGGLDSIGFNEGLVIAPLVDARTFERGSGITGTVSKSGKLSKFMLPQERAKYENIYTEFNSFMQTQESLVPGDPASYAQVCNSSTNTYKCANGMTVLQFDVTPTADFLKFEYALAGTETGGDLYAFPDGFGLFVGGIDQSHSCALVPEVNGTSLEQRFVTTANALEARLATYVPFDSDLHAATITSTMTCSSDVSSFADSETPVTVTMVIANADDQILSPAVFLKGDSVRFEPTSIVARDIPAATIFQEYESVLISATGTAPTSWSARDLPEGMSLTTSGAPGTPRVGELQGTPQVSGSFTFTVSALDESEAVLATQPFTIQINDVEQGANVRNISIDLENRSMNWDHPLGAPTGMLYDVYVRNDDSDEDYKFATARLCVEPDGSGGCDFYSAIPVQGYSAPEIFLDLRGTYSPNTNYQFKVVARWPDNSTYSETEKTVTSWRDVCSSENSCSYSQSGQITNEVFWEEISYKIDEAQTIQGNGDAFDGALEVYLGASTDDVSDAHRVTCDTSLSDEIRTGDPETGPIVGHEIICSDDVYEDLIITVSRYFFAENQWTRTMVEVENVDQASTFEGNVWLVSNLGSDGDTFYEATSSAAADPRPTGIDSLEDTWAVTSDNGDDGDPVLIHMLGDIKDEDYSSLPCSRYSYGESDTDSTRNSTDCGNVITAHEISVPSGESIKKAWFTGLVGYSDPLLFDRAKNRAIAAAGDFASDETTWTGDMSGFDVPSLFYEIPELTCESVGGGRAPEEERKLSVVLLNKQLETPNADSNQTNLSSSTALATQLCNSAQLSTTIFDGREGNVDDGESGTAKAWEFGLDGADVLVLPETDFQLLDSDLLDQGGMNYLKEWVRAGGRIVTVGASNYRTELENIIGIPAGTLQVDEWESGDPVPNSYATDVLGSSLPVANVARITNLLKFDEAFSDAVNLANANATSLYGGSTDTSYLSAVTKFEIGRGQASYLSSNFEGEPNVSWNEILLQSVYGTETSTIEITESGKYWNLWRSGVHWTEMNQAASFKLGSIGDSTSLTCMNTPSNPAIRRVSSEGTEIICGKQFVQDGLADAGVSARLTRFVSISGDWMTSNIVITNLDGEDAYENQLWFGGSQNLSSTMRVEATSLSSTGTTNLSSEWNSDDGSSNWIVASEGAGINNVHGDSPSEVVTHVFDPRPNANHGGADRASWLRLEADEIQSDWWINLESDQSITISALTARMSYEPGCDRTAVEISKEFAAELANTGSLAGLPSLRTDCQSYAEIAKSLSAQNSGNSVVLSWNSTPTASHYELSYRVGSNGEWTSPTQIVANTDSVMSATISGLNRSTDYEFKVRAKRLDYGTYGDSAIGPWANETVSIRTTALQVPPTTPPTTPPPSSPQTNDVAQAPAQIVPQMIAQTGPGFPARLKRGKTVKFGMTAPSGLPLQVTSVGQCKTTKITKTVTVKVLVGKKIKKKKVKMQTGWAVKATKKKGLCTVTFSNSGDATRNPLAAAGTITVF